MRNNGDEKGGKYKRKGRYKKEGKNRIWVLNKNYTGCVV